MRVILRNEALPLLYKAVARRRSLIRGKLHDGDKHCAMGCLGAAANNPYGITVESSFVDEVAAVNDKLSERASGKQRWQYVMRWLRKEVAKLNKAEGAK